jgi:hypothetical protein
MRKTAKFTQDRIPGERSTLLFEVFEDEVCITMDDHMTPDADVCMWLTCEEFSKMIDDLQSFRDSKDD